MIKQQQKTKSKEMLKVHKKIKNKKRKKKKQAIRKQKKDKKRQLTLVDLIQFFARCYCSDILLVKNMGPPNWSECLNRIP